MQPHIILISGTARAGKDTVGEMIDNALSDERVHIHRLGDLVREDLWRATGVSVAEQLRARTQWRKVWQWWGTEVRRNLCLETWWLRAWSARAQALADRSATIIVPDVRFVNELSFFHLWAESRGYTPKWVVVRRGWLWELRRLLAPRRWHASERDWRRCRAYPHTLLVNNGTLGALERQVQTWVEGLR